MVMLTARCCIRLSSVCNVCFVGLWLNGMSYRTRAKQPHGHDWQPIGTYQRPIERYNRQPPTDTCSPKIGVLTHAPNTKNCMLSVSGSTVGYPSDSWASCCSNWQQNGSVVEECRPMFSGKMTLCHLRTFTFNTNQSYKICTKTAINVRLKLLFGQ